MENIKIKIDLKKLNLFFLKRCNFIFYFFADHYHGHGGEMRVSLPPYLGMGEYFVKAGEEMGYPRTDLNAHYSEGTF